MIKFVGNCSDVINWDDVIVDLEQCGSNSHPGAFTGPAHKAGDPIPRLNEIIELWSKNNYKAVEDGGTVQWDMFYPGTHFDSKVVDQFVERFEIQSYENAWISRIWPGRVAPIHWDVNDNEELYLTIPDKIRYHVHVSRPQFGHVFVAEDQLFYGRAQGDTFQWDSRRHWHAGMNCGLVPKYQFNIW